MSRGLKKALVDAADRGDAARIRELIEKGVKVDAIYEDWTPLMHAAYHGHFDAVAALLEHKASVNYVASDDATAINLSAARGFWDVVRILEEHGADVHHKNVKGKSAMNYAKHAKQKQLLRAWKERHPEPEEAS